jgi:cephalosporin hydroxylase
MFKRITMFEGSSISTEISQRVHNFTKDYSNIMVILDSNHTHDHVLQEMQLYTPLVTKGSYCIVLDTIIEDLDDGLNSDRPWAKGNNPKTAVREFLSTNPDFEIDYAIENKLVLTVAPDGYLKRIR